MTCSDAISANQKDVALSYIQALNAWDYDKVRALCSDSPEFKYLFRPASLDGFGKPNGFDKEGLMGFMKLLQDTIVNEFNFGEPHDLAQSKDQIVIWISTNVCKGIAHDGSPYTNEYNMNIKFEPGGTKFLHVVEMMDSLFIATLQNKLKAGPSA